jgi:transglutaminase-like putative cysteine protease
MLEKHDRLEAVAESIVDVLSSPAESLPTVSWEQARDLIAAQSDGVGIEASEFVYSSPFVPAVAKLDEYARKSFAPHRPLLEAAEDLTHRIHADFKYHPKSTSIDILRPGPKVLGAQASHAWVSLFVPGRGWLGFDPTNDLMVSDSHVTLAWGRDYGDVTPVKGITLGGAGQTVEVEVYVRPLENNALDSGC